MLNVPKRVKDQSATRTTPSVSRTDQSATRTLYTGNLITSNQYTDTAAPEGGGKNVEAVRNKIEKARKENLKAREAKASRARGRNDVSTGLETAWRIALQETFPETSHSPWDVRIKSNIKRKAKAR